MYIYICIYRQVHIHRLVHNMYTYMYISIYMHMSRYMYMHMGRERERETCPPLFRPSIGVLGMEHHHQKSTVVGRSHFVRPRVQTSCASLCRVLVVPVLERLPAKALPRVYTYTYMFPHTYHSVSC